jgi:hypothetical protein
MRVSSGWDQSNYFLVDPVYVRYTESCIKSHNRES